MRYSDRLSYDMTLTVFMNKLAKRFAVLTLATAILLFRLDFVWLVWIHFCFRMVKGNTHSNLVFDVLIPAEEKISPEQLKKQISAKVNEIDPDYRCVITIDRSYV